MVASFIALLLYDWYTLNKEKRAEDYKSKCGTLTITSNIITVNTEDDFDGNFIDDGNDREKQLPDAFLPF